MRGDRNVVPLGSEGLQEVDPFLRAQAHALIDRLPSNVLVAIVPVLHKYSVQEAPRGAPPGPDPDRITIHHPCR